MRGWSTSNVCCVESPKVKVIREGRRFAGGGGCVVKNQIKKGVMAMECLITIVVEIGKYLLQPVLRPVERRVGYLVHCKENTEQLKNQVEKLKTVRESVQQLIDQAEPRGEDILVDVTNWMGTVDSVINEANGLVANSNVDSRC
uniref:Uncharacterized protein n=1 Tax=Nelumbo nucifera TaxID=4432 RepID=A0A822YYG2_NELNU|nr:TPA_asm: hypothetical protein HUJ06_013457 [Nelumbo nucifera]